MKQIGLNGESVKRDDVRIDGNRKREDNREQKRKDDKEDARRKWCQCEKRSKEYEREKETEREGGENWLK